MRNRSIALLLDRLASNQGLGMLALAIGVGAATGLAAVFFIRLIASIHHLGYAGLGGFFPALGRFWFIIIPVLGALAGGPIIAYFATEAKGHGVPEVMQALMLRGGRIRARVAVAKVLASALCIGSGGSAGREGPIVQVGSTFGSSVGQWLKLSDDRIRNLVACGAAAGIAATFNAPIAGVAFAIEVLLSELQVAVFGNVVLSAVAASIVSRFFLGARPAFEVPAYSLYSPWEILLYTVLGLLAAVVGVFFIRMLDSFESFFDRLKMPAALKPALGALCLGGLAFFYPHVSSLFSIFPGDSRLGLPLIENVPHVYGSGFEFIDQVLKGQASFGLLLMLIFLKPLATTFTLGSGNSGGVFAPSLFTGAMLGGAFGYAALLVFPHIPIQVGAYALVGMAAVFAAAARAPLTAMLIVFEMSNDYQLILPLMAAGMTASFVAQWLYPDSIYSIKLTKRGIHFEQGRDLDVMHGVTAEEVMNHHPVTIHKDQSLAELFVLFQETHLQGFPVMASDEDLYGIVTMQDLERVLQDIDTEEGEKTRSLGSMRVEEVATPYPVTVFPDETINVAIRKMAPRDLARLPVISRHNEKKLLGLISRSDILRSYQVGLLRKQENQLIRERMALKETEDVSFKEVEVEPAGFAVDKSIAELPLHQSTSVVSVRRGNLVILASSQTVFQPGDIVTIFCRRSHVAELKTLFASQQND